MIKIEKTDVYGWEAAIRGMRNPMNSWDRIDSDFVYDCEMCGSNCGEYASCTGVCVHIGYNDIDLMKRLANAGSVHAKYRRMITVTCDVTAPLYWWKEFDTYKVGTVANSCSTMHKIHAKEFTLDDFSHDHMWGECEDRNIDEPIGILNIVIDALNTYRAQFLAYGGKDDWWQMIQLLPSSYNQKRTVQLNYEVLVGIYRDRKNHKLDEWRNFCDWIAALPYSEIITGVCS